MIVADPNEVTLRGEEVIEPLTIGGTPPSFTIPSDDDLDKMNERISAVGRRPGLRGGPTSKGFFPRCRTDCAGTSPEFVTSP